MLLIGCYLCSGTVLQRALQATLPFKPKYNNDKYLCYSSSKGKVLVVVVVVSSSPGRVVVVVMVVCI